MFYFRVFILSCKTVRVFTGAGFAVLTYEHIPCPPHTPRQEQKKGLAVGLKKNLDMLDNNNSRTPPTTHAPVLSCDVIKTIT